MNLYSERGETFSIIFIVRHNVETVGNQFSSIKIKPGSWLAEALFTRIRLIIPFYPKKVSSDRNSIHKYLDRLPILFTRSRIQFLSGQILCG